MVTEKKEEVKPIEFTIVETKKDLILDGFNNAVQGYIIRFKTPLGSTGQVEIPEKSYSKEKALDLVRTEVIRLNELFEL